MNLSILILLALIAIGSCCGVIKHTEDQPITHEDALCGSDKCPDNYRCELPDPNTDCDNEDGCSTAPKCIAIPMPKPICAENEVLKTCGSACEPTCDNPEPECISTCMTDVCQCREGFVRGDSTSDQCVEKNSCKKCTRECSENEKCEFVTLPCEQEPCAVVDKTLTLLLCLIAVSSATKTCGENEELVGCHNTCEPQCGYTPKACTEQCIMNACDCKDGFVRNSLGKCVEVFQCTKETTKCPENEEFKGCGTACEPTCENPDPRACTKQCLVNVCQCSKGFVRHGFRCIAKEECPK
ncbi:hypothetical protein CRE_19372 [Caenorhabditis remanei]|uniref:TIL domain-containing protein n=1 Tax=Caenorhabditis remanei TaxID=31234 RepID=E3N506_CAERE|nr:hypothetical protein CRE_19372 [Caenorhabditis remanei]